MEADSDFLMALRGFASPSTNTERLAGRYPATRPPRQGCRLHVHTTGKTTPSPPSRPRHPLVMFVFPNYPIPAGAR
ncbi:hypothetical protein C8034_v000169 [Colletotrichum sidae]|uniref:Uncharacterized protein n=1 Tax=Colletotrichum sidae TaxID=1347389 RepID=A0A4R8TPJ2_9PEZI|nr:hypothetical protein C8034_v000169 [Colletotrichum sidae]